MESGNEVSIDDAYRIVTKISDLSLSAFAYSNSGIYYRNYVIFKKPFPPSIIFYIICESQVHILRILREETNWNKILADQKNYFYPD